MAILGILLLWDPSPGGDMAGYECLAVNLVRLNDVVCTPWYDARWGRPSVWFGEIAEADEPAPGEIIMTCSRSFDTSGNVSECVGGSGPPSGGHNRNVILTK